MHKFNYVICHVCEGHGMMDNPAFSNGITSSEWQEWGDEDKESYMSGAYDVTCTCCNGSGKLRVPNVAALTFAEKRELVEKRRERREVRESYRIEAMERAMGA